MRRREFLAVPGLRFAASKGRLALLTHARRDAAPPGLHDAEMVVASAAEAELWREPERFWTGMRTKRFHDYAMLNAKSPVRPARVDLAVAPGDRFSFDGVEYRVLATPGPTRHSVSYVTESRGKRTVYCGDLVLAGGRLLDLWSMQDAVPEAKLRGYHGYAARAGEWIASLRAVAALRPDILVPSRGPEISDPGAAIDGLIAGLKTVLREHFATDALRWYFGDDNLRLRAAKVLEGEVPDWMPMAETRALPPWIRAMGNSRLLIAENKAAFLMDCGYDRVIEEIRRLRSEGVISGLQGVFVTHYHDDHTDRAQQCATAFDCPLYFQERIRAILERPQDFYMPCLTTEAFRTGTPMRDGAVLRWHEFELSFHDFPGQTFYHSALLAKRRGGEAVLFAGDSFTPSGIDDYCLRNRNFLAARTGYFRCLEFLRGLPPGAFVVNQHVEPMFRFSGEQLDTMTRSLERRRDALRRLTVYPHFDFALDDQWVRIEPYASPLGGLGKVTARVFHHGDKPAEFAIRPVLPEGWRAGRSEYRTTLRPGAENAVEMRIVPARPAAVPPAISFDVRLGKLELREFAEMLVTPD